MHVRRVRRHTADLCDELAEERIALEEVLDRQVQRPRAGVLLLDRLGDHRRVGRQRAGVVGDQQRAAEVGHVLDPLDVAAEPVVVEEVPEGAVEQPLDALGAPPVGDLAVGLDRRQQRRAGRRRRRARRLELAAAHSSTRSSAASRLRPVRRAQTMSSVSHISRFHGCRSVARRDARLQRLGERSPASRRSARRPSPARSGRPCRRRSRARRRAAPMRSSHCAVAVRARSWRCEAMRMKWPWTLQRADRLHRAGVGLGGEDVARRVWVSSTSTLDLLAPQRRDLPGELLLVGQLDAEAPLGGGLRELRPVVVQRRVDVDGDAHRPLIR